MTQDPKDYIPPADSGDAQRILNQMPLNATQRAQQKQFVSDRILKAIRHSIQPMFRYCLTHHVIVCGEADGRGVSFRDFCNCLHGKPFDQTCVFMVLNTQDLCSWLDGETGGRLHELGGAVLRIREQLQAREREQIAESRHSTFCESWLDSDPQDSYNVQASKRWEKRRKQAEDDNNDVSEGVRHISFTE